MPSSLLEAMTERFRLMQEIFHARGLRFLTLSAFRYLYNNKITGPMPKEWSTMTNLANL
jgi:hypothetical protein